MAEQMVTFSDRHGDDILEMHRGIRDAAYRHRIDVMNGTIPEAYFVSAQGGPVYTDRKLFDTTFLGGLHGTASYWDGHTDNEVLLAPDEVPEFYVEGMRRASKVQYATGELFRHGEQAHGVLLASVGVVLEDSSELAEEGVRYAIQRAGSSLEGTVSFQGFMRSYRYGGPEYETQSVPILQVRRPRSTTEMEKSLLPDMVFGAVVIREQLGVGKYLSSVTHKEFDTHRTNLLAQLAALTTAQSATTEAR